MSFLGVLKKIGSVAIGIEHVAVPLISVADPVLAPWLARLDGWLTRTQAAVLSVEHTVTEAKAGGLKQASVVADFENGLESAQTALAITGKKIEYDMDKYKAVVDGFVAAYNAAAEFKKTWKIVDLPPAQ